MRSSAISQKAWASTAHKARTAPGIQNHPHFSLSPSFPAASAPMTRSSPSCAAHLPPAGTRHPAALVVHHQHATALPVPGSSIAWCFLPGIRFLLLSASKSPANLSKPVSFGKPFQVSWQHTSPIQFQVHPSYPPAPKDSSRVYITTPSDLLHHLLLVTFFKNHGFD